MKVLRIIPSMHPTWGGPCQGIRSSVPFMESLGLENTVVCLNDPGEDFGQSDRFPIIRLGRGFGPWSYSSKLIPWLRQHVLSFDAVIIHGLWQFHSYAAVRVLTELRAKKRLPIPRFYLMPHGMLDPWFQQDPSRRWKALRNRFFYQIIEHRVISQVDALLFTCQRELELAKYSFPDYRPRRELNVGYGVATPPAFQPTMRSAFELACPGIKQQRYLLFLSRIDPKKGVDLAIGAYAEVSARQSASFEMPALVIAGPVDSSYGQTMIKLAEELGLLRDGKEPECFSPGIHFTGMLQGDAKWGAFYGCESFLLPSHQENFGIAVVEALACSKPVLISDKVNIYQEILKAGAGQVSTDDLSGTTQLLSDWVRHPDEQKQNMGDLAGECFDHHFRIESAAQRLAEAIRNNNVA